jgi:predicted nucleic acid-binding protein
MRSSVLSLEERSTSAICYAEVARRFTDPAELEELLAALACGVNPVDRKTAFLAGRYFEQYRSRGGPRDRILADFVIAADAVLKADRLLTRDRRFFGEQFPGLTAVDYHER